MKERKIFENIRRQILVVDDEEINRLILGNILSIDYDVIYASDGKEALEQMHQNKDMLSLVLLDLMMPEISGLEVLKILKDDSELSNIPVIVATVDKKSEIESLNLGAVDFIPKPYPEAGVIYARVKRTIELFEDKNIIDYTERDQLTKLYNKEYFFKYALSLDKHNKEQSTDAIILDIRHFHIIMERFGRDYGNQILINIAEYLKNKMINMGGMVCRKESDTFLLYVPHIDDIDSFYNEISNMSEFEWSKDSKIKFRMGVYPNAPKDLDIEVRFDRAKMAADSNRRNESINISLYDDKLREKELYEEGLIDEFPRALKNKEFKVYYQPKYNIQGESPVLSSAEALVRWIHPTLGMVSPGVFIPLLENKGLIEELDKYVWKEVGRQIRKWKDELNVTIPVSVNVSRIDMYDHNLANIFENIIKENNISHNEFILEMTESAYTEDSDNIIMTVNNLRKLGYKVEMDDFGTGYSSLSMISRLPIDCIKLDMIFIRNAFLERVDTKMVEIIIDIASYLKVPVIAEGVETKEQVEVLKKLGCDIVQGFYFSKPLPPEEFEIKIIKK